MRYLLQLFVLLTAISCSEETARSLKLENPLAAERADEAISVPMAELGYAGGLLPLLRKADGEVVPCQFDDLNSDGEPDEMVFLYSFTPGQTAEIDIEWIKPSEYPRFEPRTNIRYGKLTPGGMIEELTTDVHGKYRLPRDPETYPYQMDGPAWENDRMGFRQYFDGRNCRDVFGKRVSRMVLDSIGIKPDGRPGDTYHVWAEWGRDIMSAANSFGLGGMALRTGDELTLLGVPARFETDNVDSTRFTIISEGPVRSVFAIDYYGWEAGGTKVEHLKQQVTIWGGCYGYENIVSVSELPEGCQLVTGIVANQNDMPFVEKEYDGRLVSMATHDRQSYNKEFYFGMALILPEVNAAGSFHSPEMDGDILKTWCMALRPDKAGIYKYNVYAAWEHRDPRFQNRECFLDLIDGYARSMNNPILVTIR